MIDFRIVGKGNIMPYQFEIGVSCKVGNVAFLSGKEIVQTNHIATFPDKPFTEVAAQKTGAAGNKGADI
jgi:hypothetical protein